MFTGIIKGRGKVTAIDEKISFRRITLLLPFELTAEIEIGASISVNGVCLTVAKFESSEVSFDVMAESLRVTTLGELGVGSEVNIERAALQNSEVGGHPLSGHIDCTCVIDRIERPENNVVMTFRVPEPFIKYIFSKGYIGLNGTSLTVTDADREAGTFKVWFIPETLRVTIFGDSREGDRVNLEVERSTQVIVDTVRDFLEERVRRGEIKGLLE
jgi:riboflavin synthase